MGEAVSDKFDVVRQARCVRVGINTVVDGISIVGRAVGRGPRTGTRLPRVGSRTRNRRLPTPIGSIQAEFFDFFSLALVLSRWQ